MPFAAALADRRFQRDPCNGGGSLPRPPRAMETGRE